MQRLPIIVFSTFVLIALDYISKQVMLDVLKWEGIQIWGEYLGLQLSYNSGIAFSLPITGLPLQLITIILIIGLIYHYIRNEYAKNSRLLDIGYVLIFAGAISHAYERIFFGYVIDFIAVKYFAILNFADIFISIGAILIFYVYYVRKQ
ncbi:signal peptidase II [Candidatus Gracilibacteria bacterium]|nr:signal peptidase II [Candidatus Gracilibacteria bacterium]